MTKHEQQLEGRIKNLEELFVLHQQALEDAAELIASLYELKRHDAREILSLSVRQRERDHN